EKERFLVDQNVASGLLAEPTWIAVSVQKVIPELKSRADQQSEFSQAVPRYLIRAGENCTKFKTEAQQHSRLVLYHPQISRLRHVIRVLKMHVPLLAFAHFGGAGVKSFDGRTEGLWIETAEQLIHLHQHDVA